MHCPVVVSILYRTKSQISDSLVKYRTLGNSNFISAIPNILKDVPNTGLDRPRP